MKTPRAARQPGRPTSHNEEIEKEILDRIASGEAVPDICKDDGMPNPSTIYNWCAIIPGFSDKFQHAQELRTNALAEVLVSGSLGMLSGKSEVDPQQFGVGARVAQAMMTAHNRKRYGDQSKVDVSSSDGSCIPTMSEMYEKLPDAEPES